jgi:hypothetical protein
MFSSKSLKLPLVSLFILFLLMFLYTSCQKKISDTPNTKQLKLKVALPRQPTSLLAFVAESKGLNMKNNLAVEIVEYPSGKLALKEALIDMVFSFKSVIRNHIVSKFWR